MAATKININLQKWIFQIGWIVINAIWLFSSLTSKQSVTQNPHVNVEAQIMGCLWIVA